MNQDEDEDEKTNGWHQVGGDLQGQDVRRRRRRRRRWRSVVLVARVARHERVAVEENSGSDWSGNLASDEAAGGGQQGEAGQVAAFAIRVAGVRLHDPAALV